MDLQKIKEKLKSIFKGVIFAPALGILWGLEEEWLKGSSAKSKFAIIGNLIVLWALILGCFAQAL